MPLETIFCPACGAPIPAEPSQTAVVCPYCNTPHTIKKPAYVPPTHEDVLEAGETFLKLEEFATARGKFEYYANIHPADWRGWWGCYRAIMSVKPDPSLQHSKCAPGIIMLKKAAAVADAAGKATMRRQILPYLEAMRQCLMIAQNMETAKQMELDQINQERTTKVAALRPLQMKIEAAQRERERLHDDFLQKSRKSTKHLNLNASTLAITIGYLLDKPASDAALKASDALHEFEFKTLNPLNNDYNAKVSLINKQHKEKYDPIQKKLDEVRLAKKEYTEMLAEQKQLLGM